MSILHGAKKFVKKHIPGIRILLYHRVGIIDNDPQLLCVTPDHFSEHLEILKKYFSVLDLEEAILEIDKLRDIRKAVVITFDDGYADNLYQAKPILEKHDAPAMIFIVTGHTGLRREFYWDDLARIFLVQPLLPEQLRIKLRAQDYIWNIESDLSNNQSNRQWNVLDLKNLSLRQKAYIDIASIIRRCSHLEREEILNSIYQWAGVEPSGRDEFRVMDENELKLLVDGDLVKVGSHTKTHVTLSAVDEETQLREIMDSKKFLEEVLCKKITTFSYPYGEKRDYNETTVKLLTNSDYRMACANFPDRVYKHTDRFQLPRILVRDWDGDTFNKVLSGW